MKKIFFTLTISLLMSSCMTSKIMIGNIEEQTPLVEVNKVTNHYVVAGLVPLKNKISESDCKNLVDNRDNYVIKTEQTAVDVLLTWITGFIYTPSHTIFYVPLSEVK